MNINFYRVISVIIASISILLIVLGKDKGIEVSLSLLGMNEITSKVIIYLSDFRYNTLLVILIFLTIFNLIYSKIIVNYFKITIIIIKDIFNKLSFIYKDIGNIWFILIIPFLFSFYNLLTMPIIYDEAWTAVNYTNKFPIISLIYYQNPNNHVLFSFLSSLINNLSIFPLQVNLRLVSLFAYVTYLLILFNQIKLIFNKNYAIFLCSVVSMMFMPAYYSYLGRGYSLIALFYVLLLCAFINLLYKKCIKFSFITFIISSILGCYTNPSFLYPVVSFGIVVYLFDKNYFKVLLKSYFLIGAVVGALYLPSAILSGGALFNNQYVLSISRELFFSNLLPYINGLLEYSTGIASSAIYTILLVSIFLIVYVKNAYQQKKYIFIILFATMPLLLMSIHSVLPPYRVFVYMGISIPLVLLTPFETFINRLSYKKIVSLSIFIEAVLVINFYYTQPKIEPEAIEAKNITNIILQNHQSYYIDSHLFDAYLLFYKLNSKVNIGNVFYKNQGLTNAALINNYQWVIIDKDRDITTNISPILTSELWNIYDLKNK